jgi:tRNA A-37 threonylcarbamoyl transferase component Bud32
VGAVVLPGPLGWRGFLLTLEVEGAVDVLSWLHAGGTEGGGRRDVLREAGRAVRRLHDAGVAHADLHPKNLLLAPGGRVLVLDLDRARDSKALLDDATRLENLVRLGRAMEKHRLRGLGAGRREALRFLEGYAGSRDAARVWLDRAGSRLERTRFWRVLWWRLIGATRPWRPPAGTAARSA